MMTCLNGYFHDAALDSLGERLIKAERDGAVAVWTSSGMTMPTDQALINQELYRLLLMSQYYVFTIQRPSNKNDAARPGGSSDARPSEKGFVAFERRDRAYAKRTDGLCNEGECEFDHLHSEPRYAEFLRGVGLPQ